MNVLDRWFNRGNADVSVWEEKPQIVRPRLGIEEKPGTWYESILYGWQHTLVDISPFVLPVIVATAAGLDAAAGAVWVSRGLFTMAIATLIMTTIGNRLPIVQGPSATVTAAVAAVAGLYGLNAMWGAIFVSSIVEMLIGFSGILGALRKLFPVVVSGIVVTSIGISLAMTATTWVIGDGSPMNFLLAAAVVLCIFLLQFLFKKKLNGIISNGAIFWSIWIVGIGLGSLLNQVDWALVGSKAWFAIPKFFPYGGPGFGWEFGVGAMIGVFSGILGSIVESIGDYAATAAVSGVDYKVKHMTRGIFAEGLGCLIASLFGGIPCTSYTQNIGIISTTKIASRFVVQIAAIFLGLYGLVPKFGALIVAMPRSVIGAVFLVVCGSIVTSGVRLLGSSRNSDGNNLVIGFTLVLAICFPIYARNAAWVEPLPNLVKLLLTNTVIIAVIGGIFFNVFINMVLKGDSVQEDVEVTPSIADPILE